MKEFFTSQLGFSLLLIPVVIGAMLGAVAYCIYFERKISAFIQDRCGPNRVGPWGLFQPLADGAKFLFKEDVVPGHTDRPLYILTPAMIFVIGFVGWAVIPWGGQWEITPGQFVDVQVANPDIGLLYIVAIAGLAVYGTILGAWASNNKYSFYGGMRATAQMISYEIPMGLCILVVVLTAGTLKLEEITVGQTGYWFGFLPQWNVFLHPAAFILLFVTILAECNRTPFDLAEAEQELVGGFHTEYSALKFGMFFLAEYGEMIVGSAFISVLFLGGWHFPWISWTQPEATQWYAVLAKVGVLCAKIAAFIFLMMWVRWTLPRFRFDQLMRLAWQGLIPISLALFVLAVVLLYIGQPRSVWALVGNIVIMVVAVAIAGASRSPVTGRQGSLPAVEAGPLPGAAN